MSRGYAGNLWTNIDISADGCYPCRMNDDRLLTITQAAARLRIEQKTLRRWADAGRVPHVRTLGGQRRFEPAVIERMRREMGFKDADEAISSEAEQASDL